MAVYRDIDSDVRINGSLVLPSGSLTIGGVNIINALAGKVNTTRQVIAGTGLSGGGSLSADRTLSVTFGTTEGTVAEGNHGHGIAAVSGLQSALDGKSSTSHTHAFSAVTSKPTTLAGYGITDAAPLNHNHDTQYLSLDGGDIDGALQFLGGWLTFMVKSDWGGWQRGIFFENELGAELGGITAFSGSGTELSWLEFEAGGGSFYITNEGKAFVGKDEVYHQGNFNPANKADASTLSTHMNDNSIHKSWGNWSTYNNDLIVNTKRALVHTTANNKLNLNYANDFVGGVEIAGTLTNGGNQVWHAGNLNPSNYVGTGSGQSVGSGFSVQGRFHIGNVSGVNGDALVYNDSGHATIHLDGNSSGIESSTNTKIHLLGSGHAVFKETVNARNFVATTGGTIPQLVTTSINNIDAKHYTRNDAIADNTGWGILSGLEGIAYGGELHVDPGVGYTKSGRRIEVSARAKVAMTPAPQSGTRYDILYIKGPSSSSEEGSLAYFEGTVGASAATTMANGVLSDAIILASVKREMAQASIVQSDIDNAVRDSGSIKGRKPFYVEAATGHTKMRFEGHAKAFKEDGKYLNTIYSTLAGGNTFTSNQKFNGRVHISATGTLGLSATSANYALRVGGETSYIAMDSNEILATDDLHLNARAGLNLSGSNVVIGGSITATSNAVSVNIPAGSRSFVWVHNHGKSVYAVNFTTNSFERHVRWTNKTANSIVVEIDDPSSQDILVDCILIGY